MEKTTMRFQAYFDMKYLDTWNNLCHKLVEILKVLVISIFVKQDILYNI